MTAALDGALVGYIPIAGTWSWEDNPRSMVRTAVQNTVRPWWKRGSAHSVQMNECGLYIYDPEDPFAWDTTLALGVRVPRWRAAGWNLQQWHRLKKIPYEHANYLTYSHGIQPLLFALHYGMRIRNLVSVSPPLRNDVLKEIGPEALQRFQSWTILTEVGLDVWREMGQWFDTRTEDEISAEGVRIIRVSGMGHGRILTDPLCIPWWKERGWDSFFKEQ